MTARVSPARYDARIFVLDDQGDGIGILASELETLDQVVERRPMDTELRG